MESLTAQNLGYPGKYQNTEIGILKIGIIKNAKLWFDTFSEDAKFYSVRLSRLLEMFKYMHE